ncbi:FHA domain protein [Minicystis rosea]|nr:FHA domain protein [Minicystis rosea]
MAFRLRYQAHDLELPLGEFVVGRSTECQLSLDDPLVSRRHAVLKVRRDGVSVQDLGSRNGVLVNGVKINGERELSAGDKVSIGSQEMVLHLAADAHPTAQTGGEEVYRRATQTLGAAYVVDLRNAVAPETSGSASAAPAAARPAGAAVADPPTNEASRSVQSFQLLGGVADKALAMGKAEDAERILLVLLNDVMSRAREGQTLDPSVCEPAARYAARLASATGKTSWADYAFELFRRQRRVLPAPVIDELYAGVRKVKSPELGGIRAYLETLREMASTLGPADRFLFQRIEGLERQMALK